LFAGVRWCSLVSVLSVVFAGVDGVRWLIGTAVDVAVCAAFASASSSLQ